MVRLAIERQLADERQAEALKTDLNAIVNEIYRSGSGAWIVVRVLDRMAEIGRSKARCCLPAASSAATG